jgi:hypothetical protein
VGPKILLLFVCAAGCFAQEQPWELGFSGGYGFYHNATVLAPAGRATAGVNNRFALSAILGNDMFRWLGGEFRYTFQDGDPFLKSGGVKTLIDGHSNAYTYDLLMYLRPRGDSVRPYFIGGVGAKQFVVSGPAPASQPLAGIAVLTTRDQFIFTGAAGAGIKFKLQKHLLARFDFIDYITPFPKDLVMPASGATPRGIFHQFTPLFGLSGMF